MCQLAGAAATSVGAVTVSVEAVSVEVVSTEAIFAKAVFAETLQLLLELLQFLPELLLVFLAKFPLLENYMFSPYIILVSNRLVG